MERAISPEIRESTCPGSNRNDEYRRFYGYGIYIR
jgi:hypothetical protein